MADNEFVAKGTAVKAVVVRFVGPCLVCKAESCHDVPKGTWDISGIERRPIRRLLSWHSMGIRTLGSSTVSCEKVDIWRQPMKIRKSVSLASG